MPEIPAYANLPACAVGNAGALNRSPDGKRLLEMDQVDLEAGTYQFSWQQIDGSQVALLDHFTISLGERQAMVLVDKNLSRIVVVDLHNLCRVYDAADGKLLREFQRPTCFQATTPKPNTPYFPIHFSNGRHPIFGYKGFINLQ